MRKIFTKVKIFFIKYPFFVALIIGISIIIFDIFFNFLNYHGDLLGVSSSFIGFLITVISIFQTLPVENKFMQRILKYNKHKEFFGLLLFSLIFFICSSITSIINIYCKLKLYFFVIAFIELIWVVYCLFRIIFGINYFNKQNSNSSN